MSRLRALLLIPALFDSVLSIQFYLPVNSRKCLQEELRKNVLVGGEYEVSEQPETRTNLQITDFSDQVLYAKENATKGKFSFTTEYDNLFEICFDSRSPMGSGKVPDQLITLNMQHGVETMTEKEIEKVEKLTPLEAKLRRLELLAKSIADDMTYLRKRGKEMRVINASTSTRVQLFSVISMCCLSALALWQVFYLRRFFKVKKLIE